FRSGPGDQLGAQELNLAYELRAGVLRDRDDVDERVAFRYCAIRRRSVPRLSAPIRSDDYCGPGVAENGPGDPPPISADARTEVGDLDGRLRDIHGSVQQLRAGT